MVRRLGILTILGVPLDVALADSPAHVPQLKMQLKPSRVVDSGRMEGNASHPFAPPVAVIRPAGGQSNRGTFILPAGGPSVQSIALPPLESNGPTHSTMSLVPANPTSGIVMNPTIPAQSQIKLRPATPVAEPPAESTGFEFSLSDDESEPENTEPTPPVSTPSRENDELKGAWKLSDDSMPTIVRPKAKSHVVVAAGLNSSIKLPENIVEEEPAPETVAAPIQVPTESTTTEVAQDNSVKLPEVEVPSEVEIASETGDATMESDETVPSEIVESSTTLSVVRPPSMQRRTCQRRSRNWPNRNRKCWMLPRVS